MSFKIPGGQAKGTPIDQAADKDIEYWIGRIAGDLERDPDKKFAERDTQWLVAARAELERRANGGQRKEPSSPRNHQPRRTSAPQTDLALGTSIASGSNLMSSLARLSESAILVAPTVACESLPEGAEVAISMVRADTSSQDCYQMTGDRKNPSPTDTMGLGGPLLFRIAAAAGVTWLKDATARIDDGRDPFRVAYRTWARVQDIDGSFRDFPGECDVDLSDGGPQADDIIRKARQRDRDSDKQLAEARKFIQRSTLTKAMNSAIRKALGLRHAYTRDELETKPFAVAKLLFTGRTNDPVLKPLFAQIIAQRFGLVVPQLYGPQVAHTAPAAPRQPICAAPGFDTTGECVDDPYGPEGVPMDDYEPIPPEDY